MFPPTPAIARAAPATAVGGTGRPSTMTWCRATRGGASPVAAVTVTLIPVDFATSAASGPSRATRSPATATSRTTTPSTSWPWTTTCSTSTTSSGTGPAALSSAKSAAVTPGWSSPVTVSRASVVVPSRASVGAGAVARWVTPSSCPTAGTGPAAPRNGGRPAGRSRRAILVTRWSGPLREVLVVGTLPAALAQPHLAGVRLVLLARVRLDLQPIDQVRVVQLERRALGPDPRDLQEVVPRRRRRGGPLQRVAVAPGVVEQRQPTVLPRLDHVVDERDHRGAEDERPDGRDRVHDGEVAAAVGRQVVRIPARHALVAQPVLDEEGRVEPDEGQPEVELADLLVHHPAAHLREPEVQTGVRGEDDRAEDDVVEVRDDEVAVVHVPVQRRAGQQHPGQATEQEGDQEADREQHRRLEGDLAPPHGADPVEELDPGGHRDQVRQEGEERQQHRAGGEHVVRPHRQRQGGDRDQREDHALVAEQRFAAEDRDDLADDAEEGQRDDVHLGMTEEPEQVL